MRLGLLLPFGGGGAPLRTLFEELRAEVQAAEAAGFHGAFVGEHHQQEAFTSPLHVLAALSATTRTIRLGTGVLLLPLHHPARVAEDAAMVDLLSGGRLILGVGTGYQRDDFAPFGIPFEARVERFEEALAVLRGLWAGERFAWAGRHFAFPEVRISPRPLQQPGPPIWGAAWTEAGLRRVAAGCDGWIIGPIESLPTVRDRVARARAAAPGLTVALIRSAWVAPTAEQARREYAASAVRTHAYFFKRGVYRRAEPDPRVARVGSPRDLTFDLIAPDRFLCGAPGEVRAEIARWAREVRPDWLILSLRNGAEPAHAATLRAIRLFGEAVVPHLPAPAPAGGATRAKEPLTP